MNITPLKISQSLSKAPKTTPKYSKSIKDSQGNEVLCGDPAITRALTALMDLGAVNGGAASHWGGPAAMAECMSALHSIMFKNENWFDEFNFVNDIGHAENGIYALRANLGFGDLDFDSLKGFRSIESKLTGHGESHLYPEGVLLSNGPLSSALPQAQGLCHADKLLGNNRVTVVSMSDGASMEGEAKESFAAIPGLMEKGKLNPFVLVISDNNTKLSGRIDEDSFNMSKSLQSMKSLGWEEIVVEKGNSLQDCYQSLEDAIDMSKKGKAVFVWLKTVKGYGVKKTEDSASGGHGFPVKAYSDEIHGFIEEICSGETPKELSDWATSLTIKPDSISTPDDKSVIKEKAQAGLARGIIKAAKEGLPVYSVSCDLAGSTGVSAFHKEFPDRFIDVGIAESNMISHAAGLSKAGFIPIVDTFAAFGVTKGNLPLIMASLSSCPMIGIFSHTGFQDAADGASHQSLTYLSAVCSIPNTKAIIVSTSEEAEELIYQAIKNIESDRLSGQAASSYIFFVGRENYPTAIKSDLSYNLGKAQIIKNGTDGLIVSAGAMLFKSLKAAEELEKEGISVTVINNSSVNDIDIELISSSLNVNSNKLITVEDHQVVGGLGSMLIHALKLKGVEFKVNTLAIQGHFGQSAYTADQLYSKNNLDEKSIIKAFKSL